jgi:hypothetical protein
VPAAENPDPGVRDVRTHQPVGQDAGAFDGATLAVTELLAGSDLESDGLGGDGVRERGGLLAGKDGRVDQLGQLAAAEHQTSSRATEGLVRRTGDDVRVGDGVVVYPCRASWP